MTSSSTPCRTNKRKMSSKIRQPVCFVHIERSGGTTLHPMLMNSLQGYFHLTPWYFWSNAPGSDVRLRELRVLRVLGAPLRGIGGHTVRSTREYEKIWGAPVFFLTILRDPIRRYLSHFNFQRLRMNLRWTIDQFLDEKRFNNYQTVRIAGCDDVELAKKQLRDVFSFVGIQAEYSKSLIILAQLLGDGFQPYNFRANTLNFHKEMITYESLSSSQKRRLQECNALDVELYAYAKEVLFENSVRHYRGDLEADEASLLATTSRPAFTLYQRLRIALFHHVIEPLAHGLTCPSLPRKRQFSHVRNHISAHNQ